MWTCVPVNGGSRFSISNDGSTGGAGEPGGGQVWAGVSWSAT